MHRRPNANELLGRDTGMPDENDRSKRVLAALVREYIASGEPVASSVLVTAAGLGISSATVRNILAKLEEEGYVLQPHTSAGRIPTDRGYRFYVDLLLEAKRPGRAATAVEARLRRDSPDRLLDSVLPQVSRSEEHTSELQSPCNLVCRLLLEKKKQKIERLTSHEKRVRAPLTHTDYVKYKSDHQQNHRIL